MNEPQVLIMQQEYEDTLDDLQRMLSDTNQRIVALRHEVEMGSATGYLFNMVELKEQARILDHTLQRFMNTWKVGVCQANSK